MTAAEDAGERPLPGQVRARMTTLASDGLAKMPMAQVPASLRRAVSFAPAKRAKLVGPQLVQLVEQDAEFRDHLATQVRALVPGAAAGVDGAAQLSDDELIEAAAVAMILRPNGWSALVERARALEERRTPSGGNLETIIDKLQRDLDQARGETKSARERLRARIDELKSENTSLRHRLGDTRARLRDAEARAAAAAGDADAAARAVDVATRAGDAEARRLRLRVAELTAETAAARKSARDDRDQESIRLRLLLDTLAETSLGLRRELALPPSDALPADSVPSVEPAAGSGVAGVGRALVQEDPALLRKLLELPRVHLLVDGYNASKTAWPTAPLDQQRTRLVSGVAGLVAGKGIECTVVFDGAELTNPPIVTSPRSVRVRFSPPGVTADDLIRRLVSAEPGGRPLVVVSTDREVSESVTAMGARSVASVALVRAIGG